MPLLSSAYENRHLAGNQNLKEKMIAYALKPSLPITFPCIWEHWDREGKDVSDSGEGQHRSMAWGLYGSFPRYVRWPQT